MTQATRTTPPPASAYRRAPLVTLALLVALAGLIMLAASAGYIGIGYGEILRVLAAQLSGNRELLAGIDQAVPFVVLEVRLPRILTAALVGGSLALCGVIFQGILLNPLADPYTLGVSSGAAFGASLALVANLALANQFSVPLFAFIGAVVTLLVVLRLSSFGGQISTTTLILSGVIVGAILSAGISFMKYLADEQVAVIVFWLMGSFASRDWHDVLLIAVVLPLSLLIFLFYARDLNIMALGGRTSEALGVETTRVRTVLLVTASLLAAICVSISGVIGFVGLIVPHLMRFVVGPDNRGLLPVSLLAGALLLLGADTVTRALLPTEVPIGVLTALLGGPFFCYIFRQRQRRAHLG
ncbi:FecCD family ABC transporter permease [Desulfurivibrio sp. D14AmB]|uniref:FecCD family ABC transporter permease n=1 Tax=Desulfurivibrio sp. D14AmB TaxID=3374370 RepID=UPI00376EEA3D